jgi:hypothetical protein
MCWRCDGLLLVILLVGTLASADNAKGRQDGKAERILRNFAKIEANHAKVKAELDKLIRVKLDLHPSLVLLGEEVTLHIEARADVKPNARIEILRNCYAVSSESLVFALDWQENPAKGSFTAVWKWRPRHCGNYLFRWKCNIGGDISTFSRNIGVVDNTYAVMILNSTAHLEPRPEPDFHANRLPFSYWWEPNLSKNVFGKSIFPSGGQFGRLEMA